MEPQTDQDVKNQNIEIRIAEVILHGILAIPDQARAIVLFARGAGNSRPATGGEQTCHHSRGNPPLQRTRKTQ